MKKKKLKKQENRQINKQAKINGKKSIHKNGRFVLCSFVDTIKFISNECIINFKMDKKILCVFRIFFLKKPKTTTTINRKYRLCFSAHIKYLFIFIEIKTKKKNETKNLYAKEKDRNSNWQRSFRKSNRVWMR